MHLDYLNKYSVLFKNFREEGDPPPETPPDPGTEN
jgi:hypothetical protein